MMSKGSPWKPELHNPNPLNIDAGQPLPHWSLFHPSTLLNNNNNNLASIEEPKSQKTTSTVIAPLLPQSC
jgi:hypothetical protein